MRRTPSASNEHTHRDIEPVGRRMPNPERVVALTIGLVLSPNSAGGTPIITSSD